MQKILIVDGHNAIFALPEVRQLHDKNQEAGRELLIRYLQELHDRGEWHVVVVFDGQGSKRTKIQRCLDDLIVVYSACKESADTVIEQFALKYAKKCELWIATNDYMEAFMVSTNEANQMRVSELEKLL